MALCPYTYVKKVLRCLTPLFYEFYMCFVYIWSYDTYYCRLKLLNWIFEHNIKLLDNILTMIYHLLKALTKWCEKKNKNLRKHQLQTKQKTYKLLKNLKISIRSRDNITIEFCQFHNNRKRGVSRSVRFISHCIRLDPTQSHPGGEGGNCDLTPYRTQIGEKMVRI